jgi:hypothetical protein
MYEVCVPVQRAVMLAGDVLEKRLQNVVATDDENMYA